MQCSFFPGFISDVSTQRNSIFHIVLGFNGGNLKKNALLNIFFFYWKCILFKTFHIKTQNNTEIWIPLGTNITNEVRKEWTLHFQPQGASMFLNERTIQFFGLVQPLTIPKWKNLEMFLVFDQNTSSVQCANLKSKKRSLLLTLGDNLYKNCVSCFFGFHVCIDFDKSCWIFWGLFYQMENICWAPNVLKKSPEQKLGSQLSLTFFH